MFAIIKNTFREAIAKKIFIISYSFFSLFILLITLALNLDALEAMMQLLNINEAVVAAQTLMTSFFPFVFAMLICIVTAASFIPSMVSKGNIDLILSKPLSRFKILFSKYTGGVLFIFISFTFLIGLVWLVLSAKFGVWNFKFLITIVSWTISFAIIYSFVLFIGLITESAVVSILAGIFLCIFSMILSIKEAIFTFVTNGTSQFIINFFYYIVPKPLQVNAINSQIFSSQTVESWEPLITSLLFCIVIISYSVYYFSRKDY